MLKFKLFAITTLLICLCFSAHADNRIDILADTVNSTSFLVPIGVENSDMAQGMHNGYILSATGDLIVDFTEDYPTGTIYLNYDGHCDDGDMFFGLNLDTPNYALIFTWGMGGFLPLGDMSEPCFYLMISVAGTQGDICIAGDIPGVYPSFPGNWLWTAPDGITNLNPTFNNGEGPHCMPFVLGCGDPNGDGASNISDVVYIKNFIFVGGNPPIQFPAGDVNCDGHVNVSDAVYILNYIFTGGNDPCDLDGNGQPDC